MSSSIEKRIKDNNEITRALQACKEARRLWLTANDAADLSTVESLYKTALNAKVSTDFQIKGNVDSNKTKAKKRKLSHGASHKSFAALTPTDYRKAGERLSLLYCQSGRSKQAQKGLEYLGFECRLASNVLDYPTVSHKKSLSRKRSTNHKSSKAGARSSNNSPCVILDNFLHLHELQQLRSVFEDRQAPYWTSHAYEVEPPTPYFSYVMDVRGPHKQINQRYGFLGMLAQQMRNSPVLRAKFPDLAKTQFVEVWAHNRPHASGHQLHFDSDDEGRGGKIRNPVCSTILYLRDPKEDSSSSAIAGGPSLITNQRLASEQLATKGWLAHPKSLRLVAFDGGVLHGVIPGKGVKKGRRVTLMMAFWKNIQLRNEPSQGSARPFPRSSSIPEKYRDWVEGLTTTKVKVSVRRPESMAEEPPVPLSTVYETLDGEPWSAGYGMPDYEQVFQGF